MEPELALSPGWPRARIRASWDDDWRVSCMVNRLRLNETSSVRPNRPERGIIRLSTPLCAASQAGQGLPLRAVASLSAVSTNVDLLDLVRDELLQVPKMRIMDINGLQGRHGFVQVFCARTDMAAGAS